MANDRTLLIEHGGYLSFNKQWGRDILNEVARTERKIVRQMTTTSKVPIAPGLLWEEKYTFQKKINELVKWRSMPPDLVLNFDQTPLSKLARLDIEQIRCILCIRIISNLILTEKL